MKKHLLLFTMLALSVQLSLLHAEEVVIPLVEVVTMSPISGDDPMDSSESEGRPLPCPTCFRATIDGHFLRIVKQAEEIPSAQVSVVNATNGGLVLNQSMTDSMEETISNTGVYVLHIETEGGALTGQFVVQ